MLCSCTYPSALSAGWAEELAAVLAVANTAVSWRINWAKRLAVLPAGLVIDACAARSPPQTQLDAERAARVKV
jgi:hypothetical protein